MAFDVVRDVAGRPMPRQLEASCRARLEYPVRAGRGSCVHASDCATRRIFPRETAVSAITCRRMNNGYSQINLGDVEDMFAKYGMQDRGESRYLREDVGAETIGLSLYRLHPGKRTGFAHRHKDVEELYVVLAGSG